MLYRYGLKLCAGEPLPQDTNNCPVLTSVNSRDRRGRSSWQSGTDIVVSNSIHYTCQYPGCHSNHSSPTDSGNTPLHCGKVQILHNNTGVILLREHISEAPALIPWQYCNTLVVGSRYTYYKAKSNAYTQCKHKMKRLYPWFALSANHRPVDKQAQSVLWM